MNNQLLKKYAIIRAKVDELLSEEAELKAQIEEAMNQEELRKLDTNLGLFTIVEYKKFTFSKEVQEFSKEVDAKIKELKTDIKAKETEEIESGKAKVSITQGLRFTPKNGK